MPAVAAPQVDPHTEEVRVAMALNGGVSLAVWMGGCAVELDCARRAHAGAEDAGTPDKPAHRTIYHALLRAFDREFVVDIMSGASAGGINGALLAAAMRCERRLHPEFLRSKWLELGDFTKLLHPTNASQPQSLMQGTLFAKLAHGAFEELLDVGGDAVNRTYTALPPTQPSIKSFAALLDVTLTNVVGEPRGFVDAWGTELFAREHRGRFRFREDGDFTVDNLAAAARATASFPAAFEPYLVAGGAAALAGLGGGRYAVDGGLLDNAPMRAAIDLIPHQRARRRVKRFVCYLAPDPPRRATDEPMAPPKLPDVLGYVVNLPRNAPFYDQLAAVENAVRRSDLAGAAAPALLLTDLDCLVSTASALLPAYSARRAIDSLNELLADPARARAAFKELAAPTALPWIPPTVGPPAAAAEWRWGLRAAERVLHLQLDVVRAALDGADDAAARDLLAARVTIDARLDDMEEARRSFLADPRLRGLVARVAGGLPLTPELACLDTVFGERRSAIAAAVDGATAALIGARDRLDASLAAALFDGGTSARDTFLARALAIEVVRRAFASDEVIEAAQSLEFVQLTPVVPTRILSSTPCRAWEEGRGEVRADSPNTKLTGIRLGHFSAFYRHSWRANDFMWGRLDAAARIVDMVVDPARSALVGARGRNVAVELSAALVPVGDEPREREERWLVHEALRDARAGAPGLVPAVPASLAQYPNGDPEPGAAALRPALAAALAADLGNPNGGLLTRVVVSRAAQLEILRQELPVLLHEAQEDVKRGCFTRALKFAARDDFAQTIKNMRQCPTLPELLGRDRGDEGVSNLALRTITHALFVALLVLRTAKVPLRRTFAMVRALALPISGIVSPKPWYVLGVFAAFAAAASYVTARVVLSDSSDAPLRSLWALPTLLHVVALLTLVGVIAVPFLRGLQAEAEPQPPVAPPRPSRSHRWRRARQWTWAAVIAVTALVIPLGLAWWKGPLEPVDFVFAPGGEAPPTWVPTVALLAVGLAPALRIARIVPVVGHAVSRLLELTPVWILTYVGSAAALSWTILKLADAVEDGGWRALAAGSAGVSAIVVALFLVVGRR